MDAAKNDDKDWPSWRGPNRDGVSNETGLPSASSSSQDTAVCTAPGAVAEPGVSGCPATAVRPKGSATRVELTKITGLSIQEAASVLGTTETEIGVDDAEEDRFVGEQDRGIRDERTGDRHPLLLAA